MKIVVAAVCFCLQMMAQSTASSSSEIELAKTRQRLLIDGNIREAIRRFQAVAADPAAARRTRAEALLEAGKCFERLGDRTSLEYFARILREFSDVDSVAAQSRQRLARLEPQGKPNLQKVAERSDIGPFGAVSPDGARLAFVTFDDRLAIMETSTGSVRYAVEGTGSFRSMVFSPDGSRVAYGLGADPKSRTLQIANLRDGSGRRILIPDGKRLLAPVAWTKETLLVYLDAREGDTASIASISMPRGEVRILRDFTQDRPALARFSPDGKFITFKQKTAIYIMAADGSDVWPALPAAGTDLVVDWVGDFIIYLSDRRGVQDLWALPVRNGRTAGAPIAIHRNLDAARSLGMSRDGTFHYVSTTPVSEVEVAGLNPADGTLTAPPVPVDPSAAGISGYADWSPDGSRIAYWTQPANAAPVLKIRSIRTGEERSMSVALRGTGLVRWFPDGESILSESFDPEHGERFHRIRLSDGKAEAAIPSDLSRDAAKNPGWLGKESLLVFRARMGGYRSPGPGRLYTWSFLENRLTELPGPSEFGSWSLSPSGKQAAYLINTGAADELRIGALAGTETSMVFRTQPGQFLSKSGAVAWTMNEENVVAAIGRSGSPRNHELWIFPVNGGEPRRLLAAGVLKDLRMHPDGLRFCFTTSGVRQDIWALKNILPRSGVPANSK